MAYNKKRLKGVATGLLGTFACLNPATSTVAGAILLTKAAYEIIDSLDD